MKQRHNGIYMLLLLLWGLLAEAQELPRISPTGTLKQRIGLTDVEITYGRPSLRGRKGKIWGKLVPFGQIWRAGANEATLFSVSKDVTINDKSLPAGTYAFFIIPYKNEDWEIILTTDTSSWGTDGYTPSNEILRVRASAEKSCRWFGKAVETLRFTFDEISLEEARVTLSWEHRSCSFRLYTNTQQQAKQNVDEAIAELEKAEPQPEDAWKTYTRAADFYIQQITKDKPDQRKKVMQWLDKGLDQKGSHYRLYWLKAELLAQQNDFSGAIDYARKAIRTGIEQEGDAFAYQDRLRTLIRSWEARR